MGRPLGGTGALSGLQSGAVRCPALMRSAGCAPPMRPIIYSSARNDRALEYDLKDGRQRSGRVESVAGHGHVQTPAVRGVEERQVCARLWRQWFGRRRCSAT